MRYVMSFILVLFSSCGLPQESEISDCGGIGGYEALTSQLMQPQQLVTTVPYCSAEMLYWQYDQESLQLTLVNSRVLLNCCGEHNIEITYENQNNYTIQEKDSPEGSLFNKSRCSCMCVYDFKLTVQDIESEEISITLKRDITDDDISNKTIWSGTINLLENVGSALIDGTSLEGWCQE